LGVVGGLKNLLQNASWGRGIGVQKNVLEKVLNILPSTCYTEWGTNELFHLNGIK